jgi:4-amino-4-deoxychorismate lyase
MTVRVLAVSGQGLVDAGTPVLLADDEGFTRGRAAFETMRLYRGRPFRLATHLDRLVASATSIGLPPVDREQIEELVALVLSSSDLPDAVLRVFWTAGSPEEAPKALVYVSEIPPGLEELRSRGIALLTLLGVRASAPWLLPGTKSTSYAVNIAAESEARRQGADDALFVDSAGLVLEGPVTNIWWRRGDVLHTPSLDLGILAGETRAALIELAAGCGYSVEQGAYPLEHLASADEAFTSSSVREVLPVRSLDGREISHGPAAVALQNALREAGAAG